MAVYRDFYVEEILKGVNVYQSYDAWVNGEQPIYQAETVQDAESWIDQKLEGKLESFDPGKYKDTETLFYGMKDLAYVDTLKWVEFWYPTMSEKAIRFTATTLWSLYGMWREDLVGVEGDNIIMK